MEIRFRTHKLQREYEDNRRAVRSYGSELARRYIGRVNIIKRTHSLDELMRLPGLRCHQLKGQRQGKYAVNLTGYYRLIFTLEGDSLEIARIEEVSDHYGD